MRLVLSFFIIVCTSILILSCHSEHKATDNKEMEYIDDLRVLQSKYGLSITFPNNIVKYNENKGADCILTFASENNRDYLSPVYYVGSTVSIDDYCTLMLPGIENNEIYRSDKFPMFIDTDWMELTSPFISMMLYSRGLGWSKYFINREPLDSYYSNLIVFPNSKRSTIDFDLAEEKKLNSDAVMRQVRMTREEDLLHRSNVDNIQIVRFIAPFGFEYKNKEWNKIFHDKGVMCYGIDFYRKDSKCFMGMLIFIRRGGKSIDEYVDIISRYIRFDPNFKLQIG